MIDNAYADDAVSEALGPDDQASSEEKRCVADWLKDIRHAREFDSNALKLYTRDRKYARGDSGSEVAVNLIGSYIDIMVSFLYARDPDVDCMPADSVGQSRLEQARLLAKTAEIVVSKLWKDARMKRKARRWIRSALTVGIGWLSVNWVENWVGDPEVQEELRSLQRNLAEITAAERRIAEGEEQDEEQAQYQLQEKIAGLEAQVEKEIQRGLSIDLVPAQDIQVSLDAENLVDCTTGSWIARRFFYRPVVAQAKYPDVPLAKFNGACSYMPVKPLDPKEAKTTGGSIEADDAKEASYFSKSATANSEKGFICVWVVMDATTNQTFTVAEGIDCYLSRPHAPNVASERFFNLFPLALTECDDERHPQSLVTRSYKLMEEYNRTRSGLSKQRRRTKVNTLFDERNVGPKDAKKVITSATNEMIGIKPIGDGKVSESFYSFPYPSIDPALYDTSPIRAELEIMWGVQEALMASVQVAKTATEAEIQQSGTQARTGAMRDTLEDQLTEIAIYTLEIALDKLTMEDAQAIAGPEAMWLNTGEGMRADLSHFDAMVGLEIRAGSTGKPNTRANREAWAAVFPHLVTGIDKVAQLRMANPLDHAQCIEELILETLDRTGDRLDIARFMPQPGQPVMLVDPVTGQVVPAYPAMMPGAAPGAGGMPGGGAPVQGTAPSAPEQVSPTQLPEQLRESGNGPEAP